MTAPSTRIRHHRDLIAWQRAMTLVDRVYTVTERLAPAERYGLCAQIRRAAVSVPANIAEGHGRDHLGDYLRHVSFALGSLAELDTLLRIAGMRGLLTISAAEEVLVAADEVGRLLSGLSRSLKRHYRQAPST